MGISDYISILALFVSLGSLITMVYLQARMSTSQIDDNIMNAVNSTLVLLEKVKSLEPNERRLFVQLLKDWDYFAPPNFIWRRRGPKPTDTTIQALQQYFDKFSQ